jgi:nucleoside-diphosphate kinase
VLAGLKTKVVEGVAVPALSNLGVERTLVRLKPDAVGRGLTGRILARFEDAALKIVGIKMKHLDPEFTKKHYST